MTGKLRWYDQLVPADDKDWDVTQVSPIFTAQIDGRSRDLIATAGKDGVVRVLDRTTRQRVYETAIGTQLNTRTPITKAGTRYCPGVLGGVQWNGPAWHPGTGMLYVNTVDWCFTGYLADEVRFVPGQQYLGGRLVPDNAASGWLTAIDAATGEKRWSYHSPTPQVAAVTTTAGGLVFTGEVGGDLLAFDAANGRELYRFNTGGSISGGIVSYSVANTQYIATVSGRGSAFFGGKGAPSVFVFKLR
jgi:alcohol dehydrogenase (cytochrome c)